MYNGRYLVFIGLLILLFSFFILLNCNKSSNSKNSLNKIHFEVDPKDIGKIVISDFVIPHNSSPDRYTERDVFNGTEYILLYRETPEDCTDLLKETND